MMTTTRMVMVVVRGRILWILLTRMGLMGLRNIWILIRGEGFSIMKRRGKLYGRTAAMGRKRRKRGKRGARRKRGTRRTKRKRRRRRMTRKGMMTGTKRGMKRGEKRRGERWGEGTHTMVTRKTKTKTNQTIIVVATPL
jgi:hypothetical protein